jgi:hypothetical protein
VPAANGLPLRRESAFLPDLAAIPARYALERHRWVEAATLTLYPA